MAALEKEEETLRELEAKRDKILKDSQAQQGIIDAKIKEQRKIIAIKKGEIVQFVKDLKCERHPKAKFVRTKKIDNSFLFASRKNGKIRELWIYTCRECLKEEKADKISPSQVSKFYQCFHCGLVKGEFGASHYRSPEESWMALAGREGQHYHCRICGSMIGYYYWAFS